MSKNELVPVMNVDQLPDANLGLDIFRDIVQGGAFLSRIQLYSKGKAIDTQMIAPGHYGVPIDDETIEDLGAEIDVIPLAWRPKAIDMNDRDAIIISFDNNSEEYKRIKEAAENVQDSHCMYGVTFLVYERSTAKFYELFFGTASGRRESSRFVAFCPISESQAKRLTEITGKPIEARGPLACTLKAKYVSKGSWHWHVPVCFQCSTPFDNLPAIELVTEEINKFYAMKNSEVEKVEPVTKRAR